MAVRNLKILFEDNEIIVCEKPAGVPCQSDRSGSFDMVNLIRNHLALGNRERGTIPYVGIVHRLDRPVGGLMVFAKTPDAAKVLSREIAKHSADSVESPASKNKAKNSESFPDNSSRTGSFGKKYFAVLTSFGEEKTKLPAAGTLNDFITRDKKTNTSSITAENDSDGKAAVLSYEIKNEKVFSTSQGILTLSLADITLGTGRHHQIRLQCAAHLCGLWGDTKYHPLFQNEFDFRTADAFFRAQGFSVHSKEVGLFSHALEFRHPKTGKWLSFQSSPDSSVFSIFS